MKQGIRDSRHPIFLKSHLTLTSVKIVQRRVVQIVEGRGGKYGGEVIVSETLNGRFVTVDPLH